MFFLKVDFYKYASLKQKSEVAVFKKIFGS